MPREEELPILRAFYDFAVWLIPKIAKFPRDHRFVLGERIERQLYTILENLIRAKYTRLRKAILEQVNLDLEILRFQLRLAKDLRCLPLKSLGQAAQQIIDIGRQVGGWHSARPSGDAKRYSSRSERSLSLTSNEVAWESVPRRRTTLRACSVASLWSRSTDLVLSIVEACCAVTGSRTISVGKSAEGTTDEI
jgi:hypothetical protein